MTKSFDNLMLTAFVEASRLGSISRASNAIGRSQPLLTQSIQRLEDILGQVLLNRSTRGVVLTDAGSEFLPYAQRIISLSDESCRYMKNRTHKKNIECRVDLDEDLVGYDILKTMMVFATDNESISLHMQASDKMSSPEAYQRGDVDLFLGDPYAIECSNLQPKKVGRSQLVWAAAIDFDPKVRPLPVAIYPIDCPWRNQIAYTLARSSIDWYIAVETYSLAALQASGHSGMAVIACLPSALAPGLKILDPLVSGLPDLPKVDVALYRSMRPTSVSVMDQIENTLWAAVVDENCVAGVQNRPIGHL
jgi:DNA-binding transcriptional LysR family regulator